MESQAPSADNIVEITLPPYFSRTRNIVIMVRSQAHSADIMLEITLSP
jgi:hypothetical protein